MKHILAILALAVAFVPQPANAQGTIPNGSPYFQYPPTAPAMKPIPLPPLKYDHEYRGGQVIVTRWHNYDLLRLICKDNPTALACSYVVRNEITGEQISCLIMLGPAAWDDERALRHEMGHCNGWSNQHEGG
jgi:hypothetical protein